MTTATHDPSPSREILSLLAANLYLLIGLFVLIGSSYAPRGTHTRYLVGIVIEGVLALGALLFMRSEKLAMRQTLRWHWPGWWPFVFSAGLACGLWMVGVMLNLFAAAVLGYTAPVGPTVFPRNGAEAFWLTFSTVIVAPVCEEIIFRGYIQRAYERGSPWRGIVVGGIVFVLYHLRFQGAPGLVPIAFALGFVSWRSNSIFPGMVLHAAYNGIASLFIIVASFFSSALVGGLALMSLCMGLLMMPMALFMIWGLWRTTKPPVKAAWPHLTGWQAWVWGIPVVAMLGIYGYAAGREIMIGRFPQKLAV